MVAHTPYSIGYSELTYAVRNRLFYGSVANRSGQFIKANLASVTAAAAGVADKMPDGFSRLDYRRARSRSLPHLELHLDADSFRYNRLGEARRHIIKFLQWGLTKGQDYLEPLSYARLPSAVIVKEEKAIRQNQIVEREDGDGELREESRETVGENE